MIQSQTTNQAAAFSGNRNAAAPQTACSETTSVESGQRESFEIASQWGAAYERQSGNEIVCVDLGTFTYGFDIAAERLVYVTGTTGNRHDGRPRSA